MSTTYTKLFSSITESTIWVEPHATRIVWIAMLAMADRKGRVWGSIPGLAHRARVTLEECEAALDCFQRPDKYSRTKEHDGRRIEPIDGGWQLLNHAKYRAVMDEEARRDYKREWDRENRGRDVPREASDPECRKLSDLSETDSERHQATQADADADTETEAETINPNHTVGLTPDGAPAVDPKRAEAATRKQAAKRILAFLNEKAGRNYREVDANLDMICARLKEGATEGELRQVIVRKAREWSGRDDMEIYLRPATLFNRTKFAQYQGELVVREAANG